MKQFMNLLKDENGLDIQNLGYKLLYATPGISGASISGLQSGSIGYTRIIQATTAAKRISDSINKTFSVPTLFWMQGESNYNDTQLAYYTALNTLFTNLNTDIKAITGQQLDVQFIVYQPATYMGDWKTANPSANEGVSMAMLQLVKDKLNVHFGCAMYQFDYGSDLLHVQGNGYLMMGAMAGIQAKRVMCDNNPLLAILPKSWVVTSKSSGGYLLEITFDVPVKPLIFDISGTTYCNVKGAQPNMGFSILNGSSIEIINSVAISRQNKVIISCTENPTGLELNYAKTGKYGGGNLRDSQGESIQISIGGISTKVHNWTPIFKQII